jgi:hypothetical protein
VSTILPRSFEALDMNPTNSLESDDSSPISYDEAKKMNKDIVAQLGYVAAREELY